MDDFWDMSVEDLDEMEKNAITQLASRNRSGIPSQPSGQFSPSGSDSYSYGDASARGRGGGNFRSSPAKSAGKGWVVKVHRDNEPGRIAVESAYNPELLEVLRTFPGKRWEQTRKVWTYPESELDNIVTMIRSMHRLQTILEIHPSLQDLLASGSQACNNGHVDVREEPHGVRRSLPQSLFSQDTAGLKTDPATHGSSDNSGWRTTKPWRGQSISDSPSSQSPRKKVVVSLSLHKTGCIAANFDYDQEIVSAIRRVPKAEWHPKLRIWTFPVSSMAESEKILSSVKNRDVRVQSVFPLVRRALQATAALENFEDRFESVSEALKETLMDFQAEGVRFSLRRGGRALIADEMGLGKTLQALAVVSCFQEDWPVLIIVPSSLRLNWASMLEKWLQIHPTDITVVMSHGGCREAFNVVHTAGKQKVALDGVFNIVSYDVLSKLEATILDADFKIVIADESHYMKNPNAKRTNACVPILKRAKHALLLTGTPAISRPIEMFKQLEALQPSVYSSMGEYGDRYCIGSMFGKWQGSSNREELHALMKSTIMIRRLKQDVLHQLPSKRREQVFISVDDSWALKLRGMRAELEKIQQQRRVIFGEKAEEEAIRLDYAERQLLSKLYSESAEAKLPAIQDHVTMLLEGGCKFLVFGHHISMLDGIEELLKKKKEHFIRIDGKTPASARLELVRKFQEHADVTVALLGIRAAGVGLTLTAASTVIFAEMSWSPGDLVQAEDRVHRIGQEFAVNICYLHARGSIDDLIWDAVQNKLESLGQVLDGENDKSMRTKKQAQQETLDAYLKPSSDASAISDNQVSSQEQASALDACLHPSETEAETFAGTACERPAETGVGSEIPFDPALSPGGTAVHPKASSKVKRKLDGSFKWQEADPEHLLTEMEDTS